MPVTATLSLVHCQRADFGLDAVIHKTFADEDEALRYALNYLALRLPAGGTWQGDTNLIGEAFRELFAKEAQWALVERMDDSDDESETLLSALLDLSKDDQHRAVDYGFAYLNDDDMIAECQIETSAR